MLMTKAGLDEGAAFQCMMEVCAHRGELAAHLWMKSRSSCKFCFLRPVYLAQAHRNGMGLIGIWLKERAEAINTELTSAGLMVTLMPDE